MRVVLRLPYRNHSTTFAALVTAQTLRSLGVDVRLSAVDTHGRQVDPYWDNQVQWDPAGYAIPACDVEVWFACPVADELARGNRPSKKIIVDVPDQNPCQTHSYVVADKLIAPSRCSRDRLHEAGHRDKVETLLWDTGDTLLEEPRRTGDARIFIPLHWEQVARTDSGIFMLISSLLRTTKSEICITEEMRWNNRARRTLRTLHRAFPGRLQRFKRPSSQVCQREMLRSTLAVIPARHDAFGIWALKALYCQLPVVSWRISPLAEIVGSCGFCIPSELGLRNAAEQALGSYRVMYDELLQLDEPTLLQSRQRIAKHVEQRRTEFRNTWRRILEESL